MICPSEVAVDDHAAVARVQDRLDQRRPEEHHQLAQEAGEGDLIAVAVQVEVAAATGHGEGAGGLIDDLFEAVDVESQALADESEPVGGGGVRRLGPAGRNGQGVRTLTAGEVELHPGRRATKIHRHRVVSVGPLDGEVRDPVEADPGRLPVGGGELQSIAFSGVGQRPVELAPGNRERRLSSGNLPSGLWRGRRLGAALVRSCFRGGGSLGRGRGVGFSGRCRGLGALGFLDRLVGGWLGLGAGQSRCGRNAASLAWRQRRVHQTATVTQAQSMSDLVAHHGAEVHGAPAPAGCVGVDRDRASGSGPEGQASEVSDGGRDPGGVTAGCLPFGEGSCQRLVELFRTKCLADHRGLRCRRRDQSIGIGVVSVWSTGGVRSTGGVQGAGDRGGLPVRSTHCVALAGRECAGKRLECLLQPAGGFCLRGHRTPPGRLVLGVPGQLPPLGLGQLPGAGPHARSGRRCDRLLRSETRLLRLRLLGPGLSFSGRLFCLFARRQQLVQPGTRSRAVGGLGVGLGPQRDERHARSLERRQGGCRLRVAGRRGLRCAGCGDDGKADHHGQRQDADEPGADRRRSTVRRHSRRSPPADTHQVAPLPPRLDDLETSGVSARTVNLGGTNR